MSGGFLYVWKVLQSDRKKVSLFIYKNNSGEYMSKINKKLPHLNTLFVKYERKNYHN